MSAQKINWRGMNYWERFWCVLASACLMIAFAVVMIPAMCAGFVVMAVAFSPRLAKEWWELRK